MGSNVPETNHSRPAIHAGSETETSPKQSSHAPRRRLQQVHVVFRNSAADARLWCVVAARVNPPHRPTHRGRHQPGTSGMASPASAGPPGLALGTATKLASAALPRSLANSACGGGILRRCSRGQSRPQKNGCDLSSITPEVSAISHQPSAIRNQPSTNSNQPSAISHQPSAIRNTGATCARSRFRTNSHPPSAIRHPPSAIHHPQSTIRHPPSAMGATFARSHLAGQSPCLAGHR
jgi:hypothetical protein